MKNLEQVKLIERFLQESKKKYLAELKQIDLMIMKKLGSIERLKSYKNDYGKPGHMELTQATPILSRNLTIFISELSGMIERDENELHKLSVIKKSLLVKNEKLHKQLDYIHDSEKKIVDKLRLAEDKEAQKLIDELVNGNLIRKHYD